MKKIILLFNTVKYLKPIQVYYRLFYFIRTRSRKLLGLSYSLEKSSASKSLILQSTIFSYFSHNKNQEFTFLNYSKTFDVDIDWDYNEYGKLWTYNLNYFDFLNQGNSYDYLPIIDNFIKQQKSFTVGFDPFPIALRGINWIKYLTYNNIKNKKIDDSLYAQYYRLKHNLEYHLLGNHLLENGFSLLFGAYYFEDNSLYKEAKKILLKELDEQILDDGGHFELSPMYHQIMLFRLLDCINLVKNNKWKNQALFSFFISKAEVMLGWLEVVSYRDGDIPLLNDSTHGIAPTTKQLFDYAKDLGIEADKIKLNESGYRKIVKKDYEMIVDVGSIGASYIPGHAHSDTLSFELYIQNKPFIVDTGLSTYESNARRIIERSTASHNTVEIKGKNQSEIWGGFRVANRANILSLKETDTSIEAIHDGYKKENIFHTRSWNFQQEKIIIQDKLNHESDAIAQIHFHPSISEKEILERLVLDTRNWKFENYQYASEFNILQNAIVIKINFKQFLEINIRI